VSPYQLLDSPPEWAIPSVLPDRLQFELGRWIDEGSLFYEAWRIGRAPRERLRRRAERYRNAIAFLEEAGALEEPARLFTASLDSPRVEVRSRGFFGLPACESVRFESSPAAIFPASFGTAARDPIPVASFADILWDRARRRSEHDDARAAGIDLALLRRLSSRTAR
jgi:hypothetical protein